MTAKTVRTATIERSCPICHTNYPTPKKQPAPTCGNPNCIRSAREQGKPFTAQVAKITEKPKRP
ncbi:unnamed protein product, partial [marine sediment metagenome]